MFKRYVVIAGAMACSFSPLLADFSYQEKSTVTGGAMASLMKVAGAFSKTAREPMVATVAVKGDRMVRRSETHVVITDLVAETITQIDLQKRTYSVMTFAQMKAMLEQMQAQMKQNQAQNANQMSFKVSAQKTDNHKSIAGVDSSEVIVKMEMQGTDQQSGQQGGMVITTDVWVATAPNGYAEVRDFYRRMGEKLNWTPGGSMFQSNPQVSEGMAEVYKEMGKLDGMPVFETVSMGVTGASGTAAGSQPAAQTQQQDQQQPSQQQPSQQQPTSVSGALGSALGGRFGFGRKKQTSQDQSGSSTGSSSGSLLEMTVEMSGFSSAPADPSLFEVPAGFKQVEAGARRMR